MSLSDLTTNAPYITFTGAAGAVTGWGLHISDVAVIVSSFAALCGAVIQVLTYLERRRNSRRGVEETNENGETH